MKTNKPSCLLPFTGRPFLLFLSFLLMFAAACKKEKDEPLIAGSWALTKIESKVPGGNWAAVNQACKMDDVEEYATGGKWTMYDGTNQCSAGNSIMTGTWRLAASDTKLIYTYDGYSGEYEKTVETLTDGSLVLTHNAGDVNNTQFRYTFAKK